MKLLPPRTQPWRKSFQRRHSPPGGPYTSFRQCLRWEFGFSCCICLCHEADFFEHGIEGTALMHVEHLRLRSESPDTAHVYSNCIFICRFCNLARNAKSQVGPTGARLLSPAEVDWAEHFVLDGNRLLPREGDADAEYTYRIYDLDDVKKQSMRGFRRQHLDEWLDLIIRGPLQRDRLLDRGITERDPELISVARQIEMAIWSAYRDLARFIAVPKDAASSCGCGAPSLELPFQLDEQTFELEGSFSGD